MKEYQSLSHTRWDCKYHVVFIPQHRGSQIVESSWLVILDGVSLLRWYHCGGGQTPWRVKATSI